MSNVKLNVTMDNVFIDEIYQDLDEYIKDSIKIDVLRAIKDHPDYRKVINLKVSEIIGMLNDGTLTVDLNGNLIKGEL